jgi:hypothetical protein
MFRCTNIESIDPEYGKILGPFPSLFRHSHVLAGLRALLIIIGNKRYFKLPSILDNFRMKTVRYKVLRQILSAQTYSNLIIKVSPSSYKNFYYHVPHSLLMSRL